MFVCWLGFGGVMFALWVGLGLRFVCILGVLWRGLCLYFGLCLYYLFVFVLLCLYFGCVLGLCYVCSSGGC